MKRCEVPNTTVPFILPYRSSRLRHLGTVLSKIYRTASERLHLPKLEWLSSSTFSTGYTPYLRKILTKKNFWCYLLPALSILPVPLVGRSLIPESFCMWLINEFLPTDDPVAQAAGIM